MNIVIFHCNVCFLKPWVPSFLIWWAAPLWLLISWCLVNGSILFPLIVSHSAFCWHAKLREHHFYPCSGSRQASSLRKDFLVKLFLWMLVLIIDLLCPVIESIRVALIFLFPTFSWHFLPEEVTILLHRKKLEIFSITFSHLVVKRCWLGDTEENTVVIGLLHLKRS